MFFSAPSFATAAKPFELKDNDRILLIGATHIEQAQYHGDIELLLTTQHPKKHLVFRNLGWAGDNVFGEARAMFGKNEDGFAHLITHVKLVKPTVIFIQYGTNEAQKKEIGPLGDIKNKEMFLKQYNYLLDELEKETNRIVLLSPIAHEAAQSPLSTDEVKKVNAQLSSYSFTINTLAEKRHLQFIDLFQHKKLRNAREDITTNGVLLNKHGYHELARVIFKSLNISFVNAHQNNKQLRKAILKRNALFFNRSRPQNEVYLRGFRKREQGNNAKEIFQLDALIEKMDLEITAIKKKL